MVTAENFLQVVKANQPLIRILSPYSGYRKVVYYQCLVCDYTDSKYPGNIVSKGCPKCNRKVSTKPRATKCTHREYLLKIKSRFGNSITVLEEYKDSGTPILHRCNDCLRERLRRPYHILKSSGCRCMSEKKHRQLLKERHGSSIKLLSYRTGESPRKATKSTEYWKKSKYRCQCGNVWWTFSALKSGCPVCSKGNICGNTIKEGKVKGKLFKYQGYELWAVKWLISNTSLKASEIHSYASRKVPFIKWKRGKKTKLHFPDLFVPKTNTLYEVKSLATLGIVNFKRVTPATMFYSVQAKARAAKAQGYNYEVMLMLDEDIRLFLPENWLELRYLQFKQTLISLNCGDSKCG